jgi:hypothetical protein
MILRRHFLGATASAGLLPLAARADQAIAKAPPPAPVEPVEAMRQVIELGDGGKAARSVHLTVPEDCVRIDVHLPDGRRVWGETLDAKGKWKLDGATRAASRDGGLEFNLLHRKPASAPVWYAVVFQRLNGVETWMAVDGRTWMIAHRGDMRRPTAAAKMKWFADRTRESRT